MICQTKEDIGIQRKLKIEKDENERWSHEHKQETHVITFHKCMDLLVRNNKLQEGDLWGGLDN